MRKIILFIISLCSTYLVTGADTPTQPLIMLLDAHHEAEEQRTGAITNYLAYALIEKSAPVLVNGAVLHNFLLLQQKAVKQLDQRKYPTVQRLYTALHTAHLEIVRNVETSLTFLQAARQDFIRRMKLTHNQFIGVAEESLNTAAAEIRSLIPTEQITDLPADIQQTISTTINRYLAQFQTSYREAFTTGRRSAGELKRLLHEYERLLQQHVHELNSIVYLVGKHVTFVRSLHAELTENIFQYVYRFTDVSSSTHWRLFKHRASDLYLFIPEQNSLATTLRFAGQVSAVSWRSSTELIEYIERQQGTAQGLAAVYRTADTTSLRDVHDFFPLFNGAYVAPLHLFMMGHGRFQITTAEYNQYQRSLAARIDHTLTLLDQLRAASEQVLRTVMEQPIDEIVRKITSYRLFSLEQYESSFKLSNQLFVEHLTARDKNPLVPHAADAEQFLKLYHQALGSHPQAHALFWLLATDLYQQYSRIKNSIIATYRTQSEETELAPESARLVGLTVAQFNDFISECSTKKALAAAYFFTCFGGGTNRLLFERAAQQLNTDAYVPVAVGALTEAAVPSLVPDVSMFTLDAQKSVQFTPPLNFARFFKTTLSEEALAAVTVRQMYEQQSTVNEFFHGIADAPWRYNPATKALELVNLNQKLLVLDPTPDVTTSVLPTIVAKEAAGVILSAPTNPLALTLLPYNNLLPALCSSIPARKTKHHIASVHTPQSSVHDFMATSLAHLRQMREYHLSIDKLRCAGFMDTTTGDIELHGVEISSKLSPETETAKNGADQTTPIIWTLHIKNAPGHGEIRACYQMRDYIDADGKRVITPLKAI